MAQDAYVPAKKLRELVDELREDSFRLRKGVKNTDDKISEANLRGKASSTETAAGRLQNVIVNEVEIDE